MDIGQNVGDRNGLSDIDSKTVHCEVLTESGQTSEDCRGHSETESTDGTE